MYVGLVVGIVMSSLLAVQINVCFHKGCFATEML